jgi:drug/metabolite transporter (DMT)-like permease
MGSIALCYAGIALAVAHDLHVAGDMHDVLIGGGLVFASAVSYALYLMGNGQAGPPGRRRVTAWASTAACLLCRPLRPDPAPRPARPARPGAAAGGCHGLVLHRAAGVDGVRGDPPHGRRAGVLIGTLGPVVTLFLGWLILEEPIGLFQILGGALVVAGVVLVGKRG